MSVYFSYVYSFTIDCIYLFNIIGLLVVMDRDRVLDSTSGSSFQRRGCAAVSLQWTRRVLDRQHRQQPRQDRLGPGHHPEQPAVPTPPLDH